MRHQRWRNLSPMVRGHGRGTIGRSHTNGNAQRCSGIAAAGLWRRSHNSGSRGLLGQVPQECWHTNAGQGLREGSQSPPQVVLRGLPPYSTGSVCVCLPREGIYVGNQRPGDPVDRPPPKDHTFHTHTTPHTHNRHRARSPSTGS